MRKNHDDRELSKKDIKFINTLIFGGCIAVVIVGLLLLANL